LQFFLLLAAYVLKEDRNKLKTIASNPSQLKDLMFRLSDTLRNMEESQIKVIAEQILRDMFRIQLHFKPGNEIEIERFPSTNINIDALSKDVDAVFLPLNLPSPLTRETYRSIQEMLTRHFGVPFPESVEAAAARAIEFDRKNAGSVMALHSFLKSLSDDYLRP